MSTRGAEPHYWTLAGGEGAPGEGGQVRELHVQVPVQVRPRGGGEEPGAHIVQHTPLRARRAAQLVHLDVVEPCDPTRARRPTASTAPRLRHRLEQPIGTLCL